MRTFVPLVSDDQPAYEDLLRENLRLRMEVNSLTPWSVWLPAGPVFLRKLWKNKTVRYTAWIVNLGLIALMAILLVQVGSLFAEACQQGWVQDTFFCAVD